MRANLPFSLILIFGITFCFGQDSTLLSKKSKKTNIEIITFDGTQISGRVAYITLDYILMDAKQYNNPAILSAYYIRNEGDYYKIGVEYIRAAIVTTKKKIGKAAMGGAISGANMASKAVKSEGDPASLAYATAAGAGIGSVVGTIKGLSRHQKVFSILGSSERLMELLEYYQ